MEIMLLAMDHICSVLTTFAWKHELADRADHTTNFGNNMVLSEEVRDNTSDPGMAGKVIPFIKKVCGISGETFLRIKLQN